MSASTPSTATNTTPRPTPPSPSGASLPPVIRPRELYSRLILATCALTLACASSADAARIAAEVTPNEVTLGALSTVSGTALEGNSPLAARLALEASPYPYRGFATIALTASTVDGSFVFSPVRLSRNTRLRVSAQAPLSAESATMQALVDPLVRIVGKSLAPGRVLLSIRLAHASGLRSPPVDAYFYTAKSAGDSYELSAIAATTELAGASTYASTTIDPPSKRFRYRICVNPAWEAAMGPAVSHGPCPAHGFRLNDAI